MKNILPEFNNICLRTNKSCFNKELILADYIYYGLENIGFYTPEQPYSVHAMYAPRYEWIFTPTGAMIFEHLVDIYQRDEDEDDDTDEYDY